jgi:ligand-binding sensor domain-containing protein
MRRSIFKISVFLTLLTLVFGFMAIQVYRIYLDAESKLAQTRSRLKEQNIVEFEKVHLSPHPHHYLQIIQRTGDTRDLVRFQDSYFAATGGGLLQLTPEGRKIRHFTVLDGLPESDLTCLTVFEAKLFIGTRTKGILTFDGENFNRIRFPEIEIQAVTGFAADQGRLLIGTFNGGLLEFDGKVFRAIKANEQIIKAITFVSKQNSALFVGTFNNGLWIYEDNSWKRFTTAEGLASNRVLGAVRNTAGLFAASDFGLSLREGDKFRTLNVLPMISGLLTHADQLFVSTETGEYFTVGQQLKKSGNVLAVDNSRLVALDNKLFLLTDRGIFQNSQPFGRHDNDDLTDNFISSMAFDQSGNLWAGTFRHGIDILTAEGRRIMHLEHDNLREINSLQYQDGQVLAATSKGLWSFKPDFSPRNLAPGSITHFSGQLAATNRGVRIGNKLLTVVNGLPNNSTFSILQAGKKTYVGTLGGLAEIHQDKILKTFTDANSKLTNNWITALCLTRERLFIGTYGGGILELRPSGDFQDFSAEIGKFVVNPNAIFSDGQRLFAGTLNGVKVLNLETNKWTTINDVLPAEPVFAINSDGRNVYFGTTGGLVKIDRNYFEELEKR